MTKVLGLTGGIAMGKSNVSQYLNQLGALVLDADQITHQLQRRGTDCYRKIVDYFGKEILNNEAAIDRKKLGRLVFNDSRKLKHLVRLMDPFIRQWIIDEIDLYQNTKLIVLDAPTLYESGYQYLTDQIMLVYCDPIEQLNRLRSRDQLSISEASRRIGNQWPIDIKIRLADVIIDSNGSISQTRNQVLKWWNNNLN